MAIAIRLRAGVPREHLPVPPPLEAWEPYSVDELRAHFPSDGATWWLSGGVALDLFLGYASRRHGDIDVSVLRPDWPALRVQLAARFVVCVAKDGRLSRLDERTLAPDERNLWLHEIDGDAWRVQVNVEEGDRSRWVYRRDTRISRPMRDVVHDGPVMRYVNPAVQLLWKAAHVSPKDDADRTAVLPRLPNDERQWLADAIALAHPTSVWNRADPV